METGRRAKLGKIVSAHGIKGGINLLPFVGADFVWSAVKKVHLETAAGWQPLTIKRVMPGRFVRLQFNEIVDRTTAESLKDCLLWIDEDGLPPLPEGDFYEFQLIGAPVCLIDGQMLGQVTQIAISGETQILVITNGQRELMIPIIKENIETMTPEKIVVHPQPGLLEL